MSDPDLRAIGAQNLATEAIKTATATENARHQARMASIGARSRQASSDDRVRKLEEETIRLTQHVQNQSAAFIAQGEQLKKANALIAEWTLSNEAFKIVAKKYGLALGLSDEQRLKDFNEAVVTAAEQKPQFQETRLYRAKKEWVEDQKRGER